MAIDPPAGTSVPTLGDGSEPLSDAERAELQRLRSEVTRLRATRTGRGARAGRWVGAVALLLVAFLFGVSTISAVFVSNQLLDTNRYVQTVAPLARDPVVQDAIANRISNELLAHVDLRTLAADASTWLQKQGAPPAVNALVGPAVSGTENFIRTQVRHLVGTPQFAKVWDSANRAAHASLVAVLTGATSGPVVSKGDTVAIDLGAVLAKVKQRLVAQGFTLAEKIPQVSVTFTVFQSPDLPRLRTAVRWLDRLATWLPWVTLLLIAAVILVAPNRRRAVVVAGLFIGLGLLVVRIVLGFLRSYYMDRLPPTVQSPQALSHIMEAFTRNVREVVSVMIVVALLAALVAYLAGPSRFTTALRGWAGRALDGVGHAIGRSRVPFGPVPAFVARFRWLFVVVFLVAAAVILVFYPYLATVGWLILALVVLLTAVAILARIRPDGAPPASPRASHAAA